MKTEIFEKITRVIIVSSLIAISCFVLAFCLFHFENGKPNYAAAFNFFSSMTAAIATIGASLIAALLFNDWRDQAKDKRNEYFILKYLEYLDHMNELLFKLTFTKMDFEDRKLFNTKVTCFINNLTTQHLEAGSRLKAISQDNKLESLIDKEFTDRKTLMMKYFEDIKTASKETEKNPNAIKDTLDLYSDQNSLCAVYRKIISKEFSEYCLRKLISFD